MAFGQVIMGPPGSGKTVYCNGMGQFLKAIGRKVVVINLDPANDSTPYEPTIDINELITLDDVMNEYQLGPNGALMYCMEYLEKNVDWLTDKLARVTDCYLLFDCPGQVELYSHHESMKRILEALQKKNHRLTSVHLVDSYYCSSPSNYISSLLLSLSVMLQLEMPHVNVLSKIDLVEKMGKLDLGLEFYANATDLVYIEQAMEKENPSGKFKSLTSKLCEIVEDFSLVTYTTLDIKDKHSVANLVKIIDKSNGYIFSPGDSSIDYRELIATSEPDFEYFKFGAIQEKYFSDDEGEDSMEEDEGVDISEVAEALNGGR